MGYVLPDPFAPHAVILRRAGVDDAGAIAGLHGRSWRAAYRGLMPDDYLDGPLDRELVSQWTGRLGAPRPGDLVLIAVEEGMTVGFIAVWRTADDATAAFIDNLHIHPDRQGQGTGARLMCRAATLLIEAGYRRGHLWVIAGNDKARHFYESLGGVAGNRAMKPAGRVLLRQIEYRWDDLRTLGAFI